MLKKFILNKFNKELMNKKVLNNKKKILNKRTIT